MQATKVIKEEFVDPVCGMTVDPARAAGTSERDGVRYYFCSPGCRQKFDEEGAGGTGAQGGCCSTPAQIGAPPAQDSCCGGAAATTAPVQLSSREGGAGRAGFADATTGSHSAHEGHGHHGHHTQAEPARGHAAHASRSGDADEVQEQSYRTMMRKFWFATAVGLPLLLLMFAEFVPAWRHALMPYHRIIGIVSAVVTLPVLAWSGRQFFESAWNGLLNHNTNMDTLVALGTGAA
jgi:YHS domain-containing protein